MNSINGWKFHLHKRFAIRIRMVKVASLLTPCVLMFAQGCLGFSSQASQLTSSIDGLSVIVSPNDGTYAIQKGNGGQTVIHARVAAEIDHHWVRSTGYPKHEISQSNFQDALGHGKKTVVTSSGLLNSPDLAYTVELYDGRAFGAVEAEVQNHTGRPITIQSIRGIEAIGNDIIGLGADQKADRVLSDSFSEDWPPLQIYDLGKAPKGLHRAVGSQLIYNRESKESFFLGALTSNRFLTIIHLQTRSSQRDGATIDSYTVDSTGTTEIQATDPESGMREGPAENLIELSVPLPVGESVTSERVMFAAGRDYYSQLDTYGTVIRELHHSRVSADNMLGWWSWTAFY